MNYHVVGVRKGKTGYSAKPAAVVRAAHEFGLPQNRNRVFLIAFDKTRFGSKINDVPAVLPRGVQQPDDVLTYLSDDVSNHYLLSKSAIKTLSACKTRSTKIIKPNTLARTLCACRWGKYNNIVPLENGAYRFLTPVEYARLQGFDFKDSSDFSYPDGISDTVKYKTLGNSVAVPVVEALAHFTINCLDHLIDGSPIKPIPGASVQTSLGSYQ